MLTRKIPRGDCKTEESSKYHFIVSLGLLSELWNAEHTNGSVLFRNDCVLWRSATHLGHVDIGLPVLRH